MLEDPDDDEQDAVLDEVEVDLVRRLDLQNSAWGRPQLNHASHWKVPVVSTGLPPSAKSRLRLKVA